MSQWQTEYLNKYYRQTPNWKDSPTLWYELVSQHVCPGARVLEIGAGPTANKASKYVSEITGGLTGLDIDPDVRKNQCLHNALVYNGNQFPVADNYFDVVISRWVNEHVQDPEAHCREIYRVLVPNGKYIFRTPNLYHYATLAAHLTPHWIHLLLANRLRNFSSQHHDPYPTYYRLNTRGRITSVLNQIGFTIDKLQLREVYPSYGLASKILFYVFMTYERAVNSTPRLESLRHVIDGVARKSNSTS